MIAAARAQQVSTQAMSAMKRENEELKREMEELRSLVTQTLVGPYT